MHSINISIRFYSLLDKNKNIDKIIFIKDIVIILLILLHNGKQRPASLTNNKQEHVDQIWVT